MKLHAILLLIILLCILESNIGLCSENTTPQNSNIDSIKISIEFKNTPLKDALKQLMEKAHRQIVYNDAMIKGKRISQSFKQETLANILDSIFSEFNLKYKELDSGQIVIIKQPAMNLSVNGYIFDSATSEPLACANIIIKGTEMGTSSDQNGYFDLTDIPTMQNRLLVHYMGYYPKEIVLQSATHANPIHIPLKKQVLSSEEIQIESIREFLNFNNTEHTTQITLSPARIKNLSSLCEFNVFQAIEMTPGVSGVNDGISGLHVRGGTDNQNLILFDGIQIYQTDHFFGLVSGLNSEAIKGIQFYRGGFPAKYGGRTSSVLLLNGNTYAPFQNQMSAGINLLSANTNINLNLGEKVSLSISGRRSYTDYIDNGIYSKLRNYITQLDSINAREPGRTNKNTDKTMLDFYYYDVNSQVSIRPTKDDKLFVNFYKGHDFMDQSYSFTGRSRLEHTTDSSKYTDVSKWGNIGISCSWHHNVNDKYTFSLSGSFSSYVSNTDDGFTKSKGSSELNFRENSIYECGINLDNCYIYKDNLKFEYGLSIVKNSIKHQFNTNNIITHIDKKLTAVSSVGYLQSIWKPTAKLTVTPGLRFTHYSLDGLLYQEPRLSFSYNCFKQLTLTGAYSHHYQFVDQVKNGSVLRAHQQYWTLSDSYLKPGFAVHLIAGANWNTENYLFSVEAYHKDLDHVKEYVQDELADFSERIIRHIYHGRGVAKGIEFLAMKKHSDFNGWLSYTLGKVEYQIPPINRGLSFPADHDRLHELKIVTIYSYKNWNISTTWLFATGANYTPVWHKNADMRKANDMKYHFGYKNSERLPNYHRMDINISRKFNFSSFIMDFGISIYNVYNKENIITRRAIKYRDTIEFHDTKMLGTIPALYLKISYGN